MVFSYPSVLRIWSNDLASSKSKYIRSPWQTLYVLSGWLQFISPPLSPVENFDGREAGSGEAGMRREMIGLAHPAPQA
jgi:hypothetical protein